MEDMLDEELVKVYGEQCREFLPLLKERIGMVVAAMLYAGTEGHNTLCELNKIFEDN